MFSILVVDDEPDNFDVIEAFLSHEEYQLYYVANGVEAIERLDTFKPDLILLDVMMPGMDGIEACRRIKALPKWEMVPIIALTALTTKESLALCLNAGADDFIGKPVSRLELTARVRSMLRVRQQYLQLATFNARLETTVQQRTAELRSMIFQDALTGLPSRTSLLQKLAEALRSGPPSFAVIYLDCDQFKLINGSFGHAIGDRLLIAIAARLREHLRTGDVLARTGEDEFCFFLPSIADAAALELHIEKIQRSFIAPFSLGDRDIFLTVSIGAAIGDNSYRKPEEPLQDADTAMYRAKSRGRGSYQLFDRRLRQAILARLTLENDLQKAIERGEFTAHYQPIVDLRTDRVIGFEALIRWLKPDRGLVSPAEFIPCLETTGAIVPVGLVILRQACRQLLLWRERGWTDVTVSVNLSPRQFTRATLLADIDRILAETGVDPAYLKLEITESTIMENEETAIEITEELRSRRIQICIDDFGTGYSSLGSLHHLPVDSIKIDRSFVNEIEGGNRDYHVVDAIVALSHRLGLSVVAEGIETPRQLEWLQKLHCEFGQGYLFSKPLAPEAIESLYFPRQPLPIGETGTKS
jgi:diguanylate cyclase (GGDEF)-like protein